MEHTHAYVISKDVDCPWCPAKAGENCYLQVSWRTAKDRMVFAGELRTGRTVERDSSRGHTGRMQCRVCGVTPDEA